MKRRVKIIGTLGPGVDSLESVQSLVNEGLDVARLNFSHGKHEEHARRFAFVRQAGESLGKPVAVLQDLCGPKIRTGVLGPKGATLQIGDEIELIAGKVSELPQLSINHEGLAEGLSQDDLVLLDDGRISLRVVGVQGGGVRCTVEVGGELRDRVGVHLPARSIRTATFTPKDQDDLAFGLELGVDYVAVSFVRQAQDLRDVRAFCEARGRRVPLVAKIETPPAVEDLDAILREADAVMVARGDLGVEFPPEVVPVLQRRMVGLAHQHHKPVIVATEMLQSMVHSNRPTRAEASDVAHAVFGGTDAVMLSAETATGAYPALSVRMMTRIVEEAERAFRAGEKRADSAPRESVPESIAFNAADIAEEIGAAALVAFTESGTTARLAASARPSVPIVAFCPTVQTCRQLALLWGVRAMQADKVKHSDEMLDFAAARLLDTGMVQRGQRFVAVFGAPVGRGMETNSISVRVAG